MKRVRKPTAAPAVPIPKDLADMAEAQLLEAYLSFLTGTAIEDPKQFITRIAAAQQALDQIVQLRGVADEESPEPTDEKVLEEARGAIADENKT